MIEGVRDGTTDVIAWITGRRIRSEICRFLPGRRYVGETLLPLTLALNRERDIPLIDLIDA